MDEQDILQLTDEWIYRLFIAEAQDMLKEGLIMENGKIIQEGLINEKDIEYARYGDKIKFSLQRYFKYKDSQHIGIFRERPKSRTINCDGKGHVDLDKFNEELENRIGFMRKVLMQYHSKDDAPYTGDYGELGVNR